MHALISYIYLELKHQICPVAFNKSTGSVYNKGGSSYLHEFNLLYSTQYFILKTFKYEFDNLINFMSVFADALLTAGSSADPVGATLLKI